MKSEVLTDTVEYHHLIVDRVTDNGKDGADEVWSTSSEKGTMSQSSEKKPMTMVASMARAMVEPNENATLRKRIRM